ncbi:MAG: acyl carrier protein [Nitrospinae bacterium]|nr:acyl carrier protein [Nitrospinota bacterium]
MASVEERIGALVEKHLGISDRSQLDANVSDLGVNSIDSVNFLKTVNEEFGVDLSPEQAAGFGTLRDLINHLS